MTSRNSRLRGAERIREQAILEKMAQWGDLKTEEKERVAGSARKLAEKLVAIGDGRLERHVENILSSKTKVERKPSPISAKERELARRESEFLFQLELEMLHWRGLLREHQALLMAAADAGHWRFFSILGSKLKGFFGPLSQGKMPLAEYQIDRAQIPFELGHGFKVWMAMSWARGACFLRPKELHFGYLLYYRESSGREAIESRDLKTWGLTIQWIEQWLTHYSELLRPQPPAT